MQIKLGRTLVVLVGASGSGKSTWAKNNFTNDEIVSMDDIRGMVCGNFLDQTQNKNVANIFHTMIDARLAAGNRVVADATHLNMNHLHTTIDIGKKWNARIYIVVISRPIENIRETAGWRNDVIVKGVPFIERQQQIFKSIKTQVMKIIGKNIEVTSDYTGVTVCNEPTSYTYTVVGDIHGNINELNAVIDQTEGPYIFLGDLTDGSDAPIEVVETVENLVATGNAYFIRGNHDIKLHRVLSIMKRGEKFKGMMKHGLQETIDKLSGNADAVNTFMNLYEMGHNWLVKGNSLFVHAAAHKRMLNLYGKNPNASPLVQMATYGEPDGMGENGFPNRIYNWVNKMKCNVYVGHDVRSTEEPLVIRTPVGGKVTFMDTGCGKPDHMAAGGHLSAMRINICD